MYVYIYSGSMQRPRNLSTRLLGYSGGEFDRGQTFHHETRRYPIIPVS